MPKYTEQQLSEVPKIKIMGKDWPIPIFGPRQNRRIVPMISSLAGKTASELTMDDMDNLYNMIYWAILRANPEVTEKDFMDWEIPIDEAMRAIPIIGKQTGLMSLGKTNLLSVKDLIVQLEKESDPEKTFVQFNVLRKQKEAPSGEATATEETLTGTSSSPELSPAQDEVGMK